MIRGKPSQDGFIIANIELTPFISFKRNFSVFILFSYV